VALTLASHVALRDPVQLRVNNRCQLFESGDITVAPFPEYLGQFMWILFGHVKTRRQKGFLPLKFNT
jgi:hypothetical protein